MSRKWQTKCQLTKSMFMYPIFISDDPNASVEVASLPGQRRWGINKLEGFIGPLVTKGLESVILFGVPLNSIKVWFLVRFFVGASFEINYLLRMDGEHQQTILLVPSSSLSKNCASSILLYTSHAMFVCANTLTMDIAVLSTATGLSIRRLPLNVSPKLLLTTLGREQIVLHPVT